MSMFLNTRWMFFVYRVKKLDTHWTFPKNTMNIIRIHVEYLWNAHWKLFLIQNDHFKIRDEFFSKNVLSTFCKMCEHLFQMPTFFLCYGHFLKMHEQILVFHKKLKCHEDSNFFRMTHIFYFNGINIFKIAWFFTFHEQVFNMRCMLSKI